MKPNPRFQCQPKTFWANVRTISAQVGYTVRGEGRIRVPSLAEMMDAFGKIGLHHRHIAASAKEPTPLGRLLCEYYEYRAGILNNFVEARLMNAVEAKAEFKKLCRHRKDCPLPMNKQKGVKRAPAYLTGIVNMTIEAHSQGYPCEYNPRALTTVTREDGPLRTLARWLDGAFPGTVNPIAVWEVKEYYYTTTFGSRVAGGVYESLLDGMELEELREQEGIDVRHYLMIDAYDTWWKQGKSYLCRMIDILHMGYVDEVLFGREVVERLPAIVGEWVKQAKRRRPPARSK
jgi:hypothetical protein